MRILPWFFGIVFLGFAYTWYSGMVVWPPFSNISDSHSARVKANIIRVNTPKEGDHISSPLIVEGEARGTWYFEASFPVVLVDWDGRIIAETFATAQSDWMTEDFVPFRAVVEFEKPAYGERGALILKKDNPSGLPEYDDAVEIPIFFSK